MIKQMFVVTLSMLAFVAMAQKKALVGGTLVD